MNTFKKKLLTAVTVMALSPLAQAGLISFSDDHASSITDWNDTLTVSQFDSNLGSLNTIDISFSAAMLSDMTLDNDNATPVGFIQGSVDLVTFGSFAGLGSLSVSLSGSTGPQSLAADDSGDTDSPLDGGADEITAFGLADTDTIQITIDSSHADFLSFIGSGDISTLGLGTGGGFGLIGPSGNIDVNLNTFASADLNVTYNYTESTTPTTSVSEPASLAILGLGLMGFGLRRKQKSL